MNNELSKKLLAEIENLQENDFLQDPDMYVVENLANSAISSLYQSELPTEFWQFIIKSIEKADCDWDLRISILCSMLNYFGGLYDNLMTLALEINQEYFETNKKDKHIEGIIDNIFWYAKLAKISYQHGFEGKLFWEVILKNAINCLDYLPKECKETSKKRIKDIMFA